MCSALAALGSGRHVPCIKYKWLPKHMFCSWVRLSGFLTFSNLIALLASKYYAKM
uniref:Uncharacterized protein n=1 Tax=Arundo donax TaxID=35708 RepID=A0A0A9C5G7_ARUDO